MPVVAGNTVRVHYKGTLSDYTEFDSSEGGDPLEFSVGAGQVIVGFDAAVTGMEVGETKTVTIPALEAYGVHDPENVLVVGSDQIPPGADLSVGDPLEVGIEGGTVMVRVTELTDDSVTLDANHPLAGEDLTFELKLAEIVS